jgi:hypothetical protein
MPVISVVLNLSSTGDNVSELHSQLSDLGAVIASNDQASKTFGDSTLFIK